MAEKEKFSCPHCGMRYDTRPEWAGQRAKCKCCKNVFTVPGTPTTDPDPRRNAAPRAGDGPSLPEANIVGDPPSDKPIPEASIIADAEEVSFLEPIDETSAAETPEEDGYQLASSGPAPSFAFPDNPLDGLDGIAEDATVGVLKPLQAPPKVPSKRRASHVDEQGSVGRLLSRVFGCLMMLMGIGTLVMILQLPDAKPDAASYQELAKWGIIGVMGLWTGFCFLLAYLGFRHDCGAALDDFLIRLWLVAAITPMALGALGFVFLFITGVANGTAGAEGLAYLTGKFIGQLVVNGGIISVWYILLKKFGFFWPNTIGISLVTGLVFFVVFVVNAGQRHESQEAQVAQMNGPFPIKGNKEFEQFREAIERGNEDIRQHEEEARRRYENSHAGTTSNSRPAASDVPVVDHAPGTLPNRFGHQDIPFRPQEFVGSKQGSFDADALAPVPPDQPKSQVGSTSPFGTPDSASPSPDKNENPFETSDAASSSDNPFEVVETTAARNGEPAFKNISKDQINAIVMKVMQSKAFREKLQSDPMFPMKLHQLSRKLNKADRQNVAPILMEEFPKLGLPMSMLAEFASDVASSNNPFETSDSSPSQSDNPFETSDAASSQGDNPFETNESNSGGNPFEVVEAKPETEEEKPASGSGVGAVSVDQILQRLNSGSTSGVKRILKSLSRCQPTEDKREAVCRTMISLLENDRLTFARREIIDILADWMTPKVSDNLVQVMKASNDYASTELIKQLARVQDEKVAATVVELWAKKPLFLREAVITLGPRAEEPLWKVLQSSDKKLQIAACNLLGQQGTQKSVMKLAELAYAKKKDQAVAQAAEDAMKMLNAKEK